MFFAANVAISPHPPRPVCAERELLRAKDTPTSFVEVCWRPICCLFIIQYDFVPVGILDMWKIVSCWSSPPSSTRSFSPSVHGLRLGGGISDIIRYPNDSFSGCTAPAHVFSVFTGSSVSLRFLRVVSALKTAVHVLDSFRVHRKPRSTGHENAPRTSSNPSSSSWSSMCIAGSTQPGGSTGVAASNGSSHARVTSSSGLHLVASLLLVTMPLSLRNLRMICNCSPPGRNFGPSNRLMSILSQRRANRKSAFEHPGHPGRDRIYTFWMRFHFLDNRLVAKGPLARLDQSEKKTTRRDLKRWSSLRRSSGARGVTCDLMRMPAPTAGLADARRAERVFCEAMPSRRHVRCRRTPCVPKNPRKHGCLEVWRVLDILYLRPIRWV